MVWPFKVAILNLALISCDIHFNIMHMSHCALYAVDVGED